MSAYDNDELFQLSPPLPPKLHQKAPPVPPKLKKGHRDIFFENRYDKSVSKGTRNKVNSPKLISKRNTIVQNEGYRVVDNISDFDFTMKDSSIMYENRNVMVSESVEKKCEAKPKSLLSKMKNLFKKPKLKKDKSKECHENEYFSSHKSEKIISSFNIQGVSEVSEEVCACSEINRSCYDSYCDECYYHRRMNNGHQFHIHRQHHCHFNCVAPSVYPCHNSHNFHHNHRPQFDPQIQNMPNRCFNCSHCNTHCHSQDPSFENFTSLRSLQSNHDRHAEENPRRELVDSITDSRVVSCQNHVLSVNRIPVQEIDPSAITLQANLQLLRKVGWYWGPLRSDEAETMMTDRCDGTFIVRDSSHADYLFSITFRVNNNTHHTRIQFSQNKFWLNQDKETDGFKTVIDLIEITVRESQNGKFRYFQNIDNPQLPTYAVILLYPLSRFCVMTSLKHIARFDIVSRVRSDLFDRLPLPEDLISYLQDKDHHYVENFYHYVNILKETDRLAIT